MNRLITSARRSTDSLDEFPCSALRRTNARNLLAQVVELRYIPRHERLLSVYRSLRQVEQGSFMGAILSHPSCPQTVIWKSPG